MSRIDFENMSMYIFKIEHETLIILKKNNCFYKFYSKNIIPLDFKTEKKIVFSEAVFNGIPCIAAYTEDGKGTVFVQQGDHYGNFFR
jgi:hypothetical protein